jgi:hypothetical protein
MVLFLLIFIASTAVTFAGPIAGIGALAGSLGSLGTVLSVVSGIASIGSMLGMFGGNDAPSVPQSYGGQSVGPAPTLPAVPEVQAAPVVDENETQKKLDAEAAAASEKAKREQVNRTTVGKTNLTKGMLAEEDASVKKTTLLGG